MVAGVNFDPHRPPTASAGPQANLLAEMEAGSRHNLRRWEVSRGGRWWCLPMVTGLADLGSDKVVLGMNTRMGAEKRFLPEGQLSSGVAGGKRHGDLTPGFSHHRAGTRRTNRFWPP